MAVSDAARMSSIFREWALVSVVASGWLSDRIGVNGRSLVLFLGLAATAACPAAAHVDALERSRPRCCR